jgi:hypothetical protein
LLRKHFITENFKNKKSGEAKDSAFFPFFILLHPKQQLESFEDFKKWTSTNKKKKDYGFWASMPKKSRQGDDSFQSP